MRAGYQTQKDEIRERATGRFSKRDERISDINTQAYPAVWNALRAASRPTACIASRSRPFPSIPDSCSARPFARSQLFMHLYAISTGMLTGSYIRLQEEHDSLTPCAPRGGLRSLELDEALPPDGGSHHEPCEEL